MTRAIATTPVLSGDLATDRTLLREFLGETDERLAALPEPSQRDEATRAEARDLHSVARHLRTGFLAAYADRVYAELTAGPAGAGYRGLADLAQSAAELFPGLAPTPAQMAEEARFAQSHREGREIDQGILFGGLLASPGSGRALTRAMLLPVPRAIDLLDAFRTRGEVVLTAARLERRGRAGHITITNAHCLNAEDNQLVADLETLVDLVLLDPGITVGVLRGGVMTHPRYAGRRVFSAGINLKELKAGRISFVDFLLRRELGFLSKIMRGLRTGDDWHSGTVQKPWLAAVDTFAIGGGAQILLTCDRVVAAGDAFFSLPAAREGIVPGVSNLRLTRFLGARPARQVILGGRKVWAKEPDSRYVFDDVVEPSAMDAVVDAAAAELDNPAVAANRRMLNLAEESEDGFRLYLAEFAVQQALRAYGQDVLARMPG
ncbi:(3,5-dihydroxyphenyl)acetyl-CoA 1,2-dioxygenase DpgC [Actinacidiphila acididurans]|uniref:Enoyl-CoA hydratase/isomerase family protein n=1 Tax=Actinacidiphila acididurans TaxID=2784346 RepID=A0ABS2U2U8_9ACTN|nr:(3,5-dihydroxyphenyl)acetyl-CoA 1,2-dioxygenase DpgC [Actinacidiphila acididurans]MBM9509920.1 enoyl-CoA hydratase/isomerase family protein [Actinacidiphila acididurans]